MSFARRGALLLLLVLAFTACGDGQLSIALSLPRDKLLDPTANCPSSAPCEQLDPRLVRFSLRLRDSNGTRTQEALFDGPKSLSLGRVPVGGLLELELSGQSASGQVLGLGRVADVDVAAKDETLVVINFRKPMAYVPAPNELFAIDAAAQEPTTGQIPSILRPGLLTAASAPNGVLLALATADSIYIHNTSDHGQLLALPLDEPATGPPTCLRFTPNSRFLFICRANAGHLSVVDLLAPQPAISGGSIGTSPAQDIAFALDGRSAYVLVDGIDHKRACSGAPPSKLVRITINAGQKAGFQPQAPVIALPTQVSDIETNPQNGQLLLAQPCHQIVSEMPPPMGATAQPTPIEGVKLNSPYDIAVTRDQIAIFGSQGERGRIFLKSQSGAQALDIQIPPLLLSIADTNSTAGAFDWVSLPVGPLVIYDVAVAPDGQRAILLYRNTFASDLQLNTCDFTTNITGTGFLLIDLASGAPLLHRLTKLSFATNGCSSCLNITGYGSMTNASVCEQVFRDTLRKRGILTPTDFEPSDVSLLFGGN